jgi:hypothetical protein
MKVGRRETKEEGFQYYSYSLMNVVLLIIQLESSLCKVCIPCRIRADNSIQFDLEK